MTINEVSKKIATCTRLKVNKMNLINEHLVGIINDNESAAVTTKSETLAEQDAPLQFVFNDGKLIPSPEVQPPGLQIQSVVSLSEAENPIEILDSD